MQIKIRKTWKINPYTKIETPKRGKGAYKRNAKHKKPLF